MELHGTRYSEKRFVWLQGICLLQSVLWSLLHSIDRHQVAWKDTADWFSFQRQVWKDCCATVCIGKATFEHYLSLGSTGYLSPPMKASERDRMSKDVIKESPRRRRTGW